MTMKFYDALQMDPSVLKRMIASCDTKHHKAYYWTAMAVRSVLIVGFAIVFISLLSGIFGSDNAPLAVALFCMMLGIRFVNFEYCIRDSLAALAAVLAILVLAPSAAALLPPFFLISLHFAAFFRIAVHDHATSRDGKRRFIQLCLYLPDRESGVWGSPRSPQPPGFNGYLICGAILFAKHRNQHRTIRFLHVIRGFDLSSPVDVWQLRMALGVSLVMTAGQTFGVERFMWMGFAWAFARITGTKQQ